MSQMFRVEKAADLPHPGKCIKCGVNYDREFYINTGVEAEWEGVVIFCNECVKAMGILCWGFDALARVEEVENIFREQAAMFAQESSEYARLLASLHTIHIDPETVHTMARVEREEEDGRGSNLDDSPNDDLGNQDGPSSSDGETSRDDSESSDGSTGDNSGESGNPEEPGSFNISFDDRTSPESNDASRIRFTL